MLSVTVVVSFAMLVLGLYFPGISIIADHFANVGWVLQFATNVAFFIMGIKRGYADGSTYLFVLIPVLLAVSYGFLRFYVEVPNKNFKKYWDGCAADGSEARKRRQYREIVRKNLFDLWRSLTVYGVSTYLLFCMLVGPSVLWIKVS